MCGAIKSRGLNWPILSPATGGSAEQWGLGWMLVGVLGACLVGMGLHAFRDNVLGAAMAGTVCPLERSRPT